MTRGGAHFITPAVHIGLVAAGGWTATFLCRGCRSASGLIIHRRTRARAALDRIAVILRPFVAQLAQFAECWHPRPNGPTVARVTPTRSPQHETNSHVHLSINGERREWDLDHRTSLLDALRDELGLTGTKKGCDHGQCGACTVLVDGRRANSCLLLAVAVQDREITTIEGVAGIPRTGPAGSLHPIQTAFLDRDAYQCGYCTPGQICSAIGVLDEAARGWPSAITPAEVATADGPVVLDADEVRERMAGNLCRCGAYANIVPAVLDAAVGDLG